ncbi:MAG: hypothetical protein HGB20_08995 [Chlorobiaceae bacterium]|nr:hypothetical protein [Chlorobiaceae bacterium]
MKYSIAASCLFLLLSTCPAYCEERLPAAPERHELESLARNHAYRLLESGRTVTLKDGVFSERGPDGIELSARLAGYAITELNGDGRPDLAAIIEHHVKGRPSEYEISVLYSSGVGFEQTAPVSLGEDITLNRLHTEEARLFMPKRIVVDYQTGSMPDSPAHPAYDKRRDFYLDGGALKDIASMQVVKKPALYLYPEKEMKIDVRLGPKGRIVRTIPAYPGKWSVTVEPGGCIDRRYRYLFYEAALSNPIAQPEEGWCVPKNELRSWMGSRLERLGLNRQEAKDFKAYWMKHLPASKFWIIRLIRPEVVEDQLGLHIQPAPQSLLRIILSFTPSEYLVKLAEPETPRFRRKGFTAVEWGGILGGTAKKDEVR